MEIKQANVKNAQAVKITLEEAGQTVARCYLYLIRNDQHDKPYGFIEDLFVDQSSRGQGLGNKILDAVIAEAKELGCYKLLGTTRHAKKQVQDWYKRKGFKDWGMEFRMDLD